MPNYKIARIIDLSYLTMMDKLAGQVPEISVDTVDSKITNIEPPKLEHQGMSRKITPMRHIKDDKFYADLSGRENSQNSLTGGWDKGTKRWGSYTDIKGGPAAIAFGHNLLPEETKSGKISIGDSRFDIKGGLTNDQAMALLRQDAGKKMGLAKNDFAKFDDFPFEVQEAIIDGYYRSDLSGSPNAIKMMNAGDWKGGAAEYLNHNEYTAKDSLPGIVSRMARNADAFNTYGDKMFNDRARVAKEEYINNLPDKTKDPWWKKIVMKSMDLSEKINNEASTWKPNMGKWEQK